MSDMSHTNGVSNICRQFLQLFSYMVHLRYPEDHIRIMTVSILINDIKDIVFSHIHYVKEKIMFTNTTKVDDLKN